MGTLLDEATKNFTTAITEAAKAQAVEITGIEVYLAALVNPRTGHPQVATMVLIVAPSPIIGEEIVILDVVTQFPHQATMEVAQAYASQAIPAIVEERQRRMQMPDNQQNGSVEGRTGSRLIIPP